MKRRKNRIVVYLLSLLLIFNISVQPAYATGYVPALDAGAMISVAEWSENASTLLQEALTKYGAMGAVALQNATIVVGSAAFAYGATKGIEFAVDSSMTTAATLGRYIIANVATMSSEIQRTVASVIFNIDADAYYYETRSMVYSSQLLSSLDVFLGNYVSANTIAMNVGLTSQGVIPSNYLAAMTLSIYDLYEAMPKPIYLANTSYHFPYQIYSVPRNSFYVLINSAGTNATILDASGVQVIMTGIATSSYWLYYNSLSTPYGWKSSWLTSSSYTITGYDIDWGGLTVLQGNSFADAIGVTTDFPLGLDLTGILDVPLTINGDLVIPYTDAISIGTGDIALEDVADVTTSTDTGATGITGAITAALSGFLDKLIEALKALLEWLFIPDAGFLDSFLQGMINSIENRTGILTYPLSVLLTFLGKVLTIGNMEAVLTIPEVAFKGSILIPTTTFSFNSLMASSPALSTAYGYYMIVARAILIFAVLRLAWRKFEEMMRD